MSSPQELTNQITSLDRKNHKSHKTIRDSNSRVDHAHPRTHQNLSALRRAPCCIGATGTLQLDTETT
jgi:hypothetical protein